MAEEKIGVISHFFDKVSVAAIQLEGSLKIGDTIHIKGATTDLIQEIESMQINREPIEEAGPGDDIGIKLNGKAKANDEVFKVVEEE